MCGLNIGLYTECWDCNMCVRRPKKNGYGNSWTKIGFKSIPKKLSFVMRDRLLEDVYLDVFSINNHSKSIERVFQNTPMFFLIQFLSSQFVLAGWLI